MDAEKRDVVQIEIGIEKLASLFNKGELCATDFSCLNNASKKYIWNLCLTSCVKRVQCNSVCFKCHEDCGQSAELIGIDSKSIHSIGLDSIDLYLKQ